MSGTGPAGRSRVRQAALVVGVTAAVVAVVAIPLWVNDDSPAAGLGASFSAAPTAVSSAGVASPTPSGPVPLADGQTVQADGRVVSVPGKPARFCAPEAMDAVAYAPGREPAPKWCPLGVDVTGVDLHALSIPRTKEGATEGYAFLRGVYRSGTLAVSVQSAQRQQQPDFPMLTTPPCPVPAGGWHRESRGSNPPIADAVSTFSASHLGQVVTIAIFRPNGTTGVVVAAVTDLAVAKAALPDKPAELCLIAAKYTMAQVTAAEAPFIAEIKAHLTSPGGQVYGIGRGVGPDGQSVLQADVVTLTTTVRGWASAAPAGLVHLVPWLAAVGPGASLPALLPTGPPTVSPASASLYASEDAAYPSAPASS
ncbi:hypothetical protein acdb102_14940 [Acidothermaceae bacterium B102]|nr:hypothetical protein acdb102_14940 [Acidothermaceae bacterium B102]